MRWTAISCAVRAAILLAFGIAIPSWAIAAPDDPEGDIAPPPAAPTAAPEATGQDGASISPADSSQLAEVTVTARRLQLIGHTTTASQGVVTGTEVNLAPAFRPGQVLETVPGLDVTTHSGEGKANQYLMRGYSLDHGTDLAIFVDGMPVNEPTHAHGQGYADINFLLPQLVGNLTYTKGPYYADIGDFGSVGSLHIDYLSTIPEQLALTVGTLDFQHYFAAGSTRVGDGNLLAALEYLHYDGPTTMPGDQQKYNGALRFSDGDPHKGYSITALVYHDTWNAQTDAPYHALANGQLSSRWDQLDKTDGGSAQRSSLSWQYHDHLGDGQFLANAYLISNHLTLWNDFTHFLTDPIDGDQEAQHEDRTTVGGDSSYDWQDRLGPFGNEWLVGLHMREDYNRVYRLPSTNRRLLTPAQIAAVDYDPFAIEDDDVRLSSVAAFVQTTTHWTDQFRSVLGFREDYMYGTDRGTWSGAASRALAEPKASLIYRISPDTELYGSWGIGFHSDDLRGVNQARTLGEQAAPLIASQSGEELGLRQDLLDHRIALTVALFSMNAQSETTYDPDAGQDSAGPASVRRGYEINLTYQATRWLEIYASYSGDHSRYRTIYDDGSGHAGRYLPNAPVGTGTLNLYVNHLGPWSGSLEYRFLGRFPVTAGPCANDAVAADFGPGYSCANAPMYNHTNTGTVWGAGYGEWNGDVTYALPHGWSVGLGVYNILNSHVNSMEYYYVYRLQGAAGPEAGETFHPLEPISARLTFGKTF